MKVYSGCRVLHVKEGHQASVCPSHVLSCPVTGGHVGHRLLSTSDVFGTVLSVSCTHRPSVLPTVSGRRRSSPARFTNENYRQEMPSSYVHMADGGGVLCPQSAWPRNLCPRPLDGSAPCAPCRRGFSHLQPGPSILEVSFCR